MPRQPRRSLTPERRLVQIYTGLVYRGPQLIREIACPRFRTLTSQLLLMSDWKSTTLTLGHSPDPDDAFMFYAMAENKIDLKGYRFTHILEDIQTLNERATRGELHITALSIHALAYVLDRYALLPSGASMGNGYGPFSSPRILMVSTKAPTI